MKSAALRTRLEPLKPKLDACVHCGLCLSACPTHLELGTEPDSPRGRIYLIRALAEGRITPTEGVLTHLDRCLDCRGCETACPSGVRYGEIIEGARAALEPERARTPFVRLARRLGLGSILSDRIALARVVAGLRWYHALGGARLVATFGFLLPAPLLRIAKMTPRLSGRAFSASTPEVVAAIGAARGRVGFFAGCVMDHTMAHVHEATVRILIRNGFDVVIPSTQVCCGALHVHNGDPGTARALARRNIEAFRGVDRIVQNSAGCGTQLREYGELLGDTEGAAVFANDCVDLSVFLTSIAPGARPPDRPLRPVNRRAVYDDPCHLIHAQRVSKEPRALLAAIPGLDILPLTEADLCCGAAGVYNLTQPELADRLLVRKVRHILASGADLVVTANPGCLLQLEAGLRAARSKVEVRHLAEVLDWAGW